MTKYKRLLTILPLLFFSVILVYSLCSYSGVSILKNENSVSALSKLGSRGDEVRRVQKKLKSLGYYKGAVDGVYGTGTQKAVKEFQQNCGIKADGIAGPKTIRYLGLEGTQNVSGYSSSDITLLAKLIAAEARGESYTGQVAVGAVVLNRVSHPSFPDTIAGVIYQKGAFSCVNDSNWSVEPNATSYKAAEDCLNGWDPSGGAVYYFNPKKTNDKFMHSRPVITIIGNHHFCN